MKIGFNNNVEPQNGSKRIHSASNIAFKGDTQDNLESGNLNVRRLAVLISQNVPAKKLLMQYEGVLELAEQKQFSNKLILLISKLQHKYYLKFNKEAFEEKLSIGFAQIMSNLIPPSFRIARKDGTYDFPYAINMSAINLLNTTDNFYDFNCVMQIYMKYLEAYCYNKDSDLPIAEEAVVKDGYADIKFSKELEYQTEEY